MITLSEFNSLARTHNVIPLTQRMLADVITPVSAYLSLRDERVPSFLFESVEQDERLGRHSFIGIDPVFVLTSKGEAVSLTQDGEERRMEGNIFTILKQLQSSYRYPSNDSVAGFSGGFVGFFGYDCVRFIESIPVAPAKPADAPDAMLGLFADILRFDHRSHSLTLVHNVLLSKDKSYEEQYHEGIKRLEALQLRLRRTPVVTTQFSCRHAPKADDKDVYLRMVSNAARYIHAGDIFQVVLSRKVRTLFDGDPFAAYRALRVINPSPYLFYLEFGDLRLIGSSPEVLVRVQSGTAELLPIAGTRPRGSSDEQDVKFEQELLRSEKECAEHVMLVDLGRNDVGRIAEYGSVDVPVFKRVERYSHVMHLVSLVRGRLKTDCSAIDALRACFPAGTVSGAPKVRAMEIISELEGERRGIYGGGVGYLGFNGDLDTCIAIRTIVAHRNVMTVQAGAGVVADSMAEEEYKETVNKAAAMMAALDMASRGLKLDQRRDGR